jgi:hypothetical protein
VLWACACEDEAFGSAFVGASFAGAFADAFGASGLLESAAGLEAEASGLEASLGTSRLEMSSPSSASRAMGSPTLTAEVPSEYYFVLNKPF